MKISDKTIKDIKGHSLWNLKMNGESDAILHFIYEGGIIFDVGANVGDWSSLVLSSFSDVKMYLFEPLSKPFAELCRRIKREDIFLHQIALSDKEKDTTIFYYPTSNRLSTLHRRSKEIEKRFSLKPILIPIRTQTLDNFCRKANVERIDFLKIDTEGCELEILKGAVSMITCQRIKTIQFEYGECFKDSNSSLQEIWSFLISFGYKIYYILPKELIPVDRWYPCLENYFYSNYLAVLERKF